jgi:hypothetical protein
MGEILMYNNLIDNKIDLYAYPNGIYFLLLTDEERRKVYKLMKQ